MNTRPEGRDHLGSDALQMAERPMGRLETSLNGEKLLAKGLRGVGRDFCSSQPSLVAASLDGLTSGNGVTRKVLYARRKNNYEVGSRLI